MALLKQGWLSYGNGICSQARGSQFLPVYYKGLNLVGRLSANLSASNSNWNILNSEFVFHSPGGVDRLTRVWV